MAGFSYGQNQSIGIESMPKTPLTFHQAAKEKRGKEFAREHRLPQGREQHPHARERFERVLDLACRGALEGKQKPGKH